MGFQAKFFPEGNILEIREDILRITSLSYNFEMEQKCFQREYVIAALSRTVQEHRFRLLG